MEFRRSQQETVSFARILNGKNLEAKEPEELRKEGERTTEGGVEIEKKSFSDWTKKTKREDSSGKKLAMANIARLETERTRNFLKKITRPCTRPCTSFWWKAFTENLRQRHSVLTLQQVFLEFGWQTRSSMVSFDFLHEWKNKFINGQVDSGNLLERWIVAVHK